MPGEDYITILSESLQKKNKILDAIRAANEEQKVLLADEMLGPDDFERTLDKKAALVEELNCLDDGFQQIYEQVRPEIEQNMDKYAEQIRQMQELIREIVAKTMSAQAEEARNKQLIEKKFASVKKQIREVKSSQKAVNTYYQNMMKNAYLDSQFLDRKKSKKSLFAIKYRRICPIYITGKQGNTGLFPSCWTVDVWKERTAGRIETVTKQNEMG